MSVQDRSFWLVLSLATAGGLVLGALILYYPFFGDQALFSVFARMMRDGSVLYRDIWDVKQPGIFWLFSVAGSLFGRGEVAVHALEIVYWLVAGVLIALAIRTSLKRQWLAALAPLLVPGIYFVVADVTDLSQVEVWISPLLFFVVWLVMPRSGPSGPRLLTAGVLTGVIGIFKLLAMAIPGAVVLFALLTIERRSLRRVVRSLGWFALGALIPLGLLAAWVAGNDLWAEVRFAWFEYPPQMFTAEPRPPMRLVRSAGEFFLGFAVLLVPAIRRIIRPSERGRRLTVLLLVACMATAVVIALQLWWAYLFYMFLALVLVLGLQGLDDLEIGSRNRARIVGLVIAVTLIPAGMDLVVKTSRLTGLAGGETVEAYQSFDPGFTTASVDADAAPVPEQSRIYIVGDPLIMELLDADQSIPVNGWSPEFWTEEVWRRVSDDLGRGTTQALFISDLNRGYAQLRAEFFLEGVEQAFEETARTADGTWYVPRTR